MIRRPPRSTLDRSSAASDVYKRQIKKHKSAYLMAVGGAAYLVAKAIKGAKVVGFADLGMEAIYEFCLLYTSPSPRDRTRSRMPSSA